MMMPERPRTREVLIDYLSDDISVLRWELRVTGFRQRLIRTSGTEEVRQALREAEDWLSEIRKQLQEAR